MYFWWFSLFFNYILCRKICLKRALFNRYSINTINITSLSVHRQIALELNARLLSIISLFLSHTDILTLISYHSLTYAQASKFRLCPCHVYMLNMISLISHLFFFQNLHIKEQIRLRCLPICLTTSIVLSSITSVFFYFSLQLVCKCLEFIV